MNSMKLGKLILATSMAALLFGAAQAAIVTVTPSSLGGWSAQNVQGSGTVAITGTEAHSGNGSLEFGGTDSSAKADFQLNVTPFLLSSLTSLSIDLYRAGSSNVADHLAPAVRLLVDNGQATDRYSYLVWEPVYNGVGTVVEDVWTTYNLSLANFWQRAFKSTPPNQTIEIYDRDLSEWSAGGTVTDSGGHTSNVVGPNAMVLQFQIGYGSGWSGAGSMFADNLTIGDTTYNFEASAVSAVPEPGSLALVGLALASLMVIRKRKN